MRQWNRRALATAVAAVALCGTSAGARAQESNEELRAEIKALRDRVNQLESRQADAATPAAAQQKTTVETITVKEQVAADADDRSAGVLAGYEEGKFFLKSADDSFSLVPGAQLQIRYTVNSRDDDDDDLQDGFEIRRAKFNFAGHMF